MLDSIFSNVNFDIKAVLIAMGAAIILGIFIGILYKISNAESGSFAVVVAILPLLVTIVIMIVNGNIGTSVAVLGAFGLIRFRSAPGSAKEICFIFFAMAVGLATGMGFFTLAVLLTMVCGLFILILEKINFGSSLSSERELRITIPEDLNYDDIFDDIFSEYTKSIKLEKVKTCNMGTMYELSYRIKMKDMKQQKEFMDKLRCRNGNLTIVLGLVQSGNW
ncbi:MAG: DUF4956 domain-containing protein [Clostridia bacterium]|nr:DUF4956 domain-containing protein [Clostridia bacterium]